MKKLLGLVFGSVARFYAVMVAVCALCLNLVQRFYAAVMVAFAFFVMAAQTWAQTNAPGVADVEGMLDDGASIFNKAAGIVMAVIGFGIIISFAVLVKKRR